MTAREAMTHPWLTIRVQIALGAIFIAASVYKIADPPAFAHMIYNYRILPAWAINITALLMPWVELFTGLALVIGVWKKPANALIAAMLIVFIIAIGFNLGRDNAIDCGCFDTSRANRTHAQRIGDMKWDILRDLGMLLMSAQLWLSWRVRERQLE